MKIKVNGVNLHYTKEGNGPVVILLHANSSNLGYFEVCKELLKKEYTVYSVDSRGHGKSQRVEEFHYRDMVEDIKQFIDTMKISNPIIIGHSDGAIIGLLLAQKYPFLLSCLVSCGASLNPRSIFSKEYYILKAVYFFTRNKKIKLMLEEPDIDMAHLKTIKIPVLVLAGEKDIVKEEVTKEIASNIKGSKLKIIRGESHGSYVKKGAILYREIKDFLRNNSQKR